MKFIILLAVQFLIVHLSYSAVAILKDSTNPDHPGKCYWNGTNPHTILAPGDTVTLKGECVRAVCHSDFRMDFTMCGAVSRREEFYKPANLSLPYPDCCPTYEPTTVANNN